MADLGDDYWQLDLSRFQELAATPGGILSFDVTKLCEALYLPPIYEHVEAVLEEERTSGIDGRRYAPRLMMALMIKLHDLAAAE